MAMLDGARITFETADFLYLHSFTVLFNVYEGELRQFGFG